MLVFLSKTQLISLIILQSMMASNSLTILDREDSLRRLFNADPTLDVYILEAVKLHMMAEALDLQVGNSRSQNVDKSLFYRFMNTREITENQTDFMNNYLHQGSDTFCVEKVCY